MDNSGLLQRQKRILIICDDQDVTMSFGSVLEQNGYMTDSYTDPVLAYKNFRDGQYDLVLLDIKMPVVDGFLLYQRIRSIDSWVKICFLTASEFFDESVRKEHIRKEQGLGDLNQEIFLRIPIDNKVLFETAKKLLSST